MFVVYAVRFDLRWFRSDFLWDRLRTRRKDWSLTQDAFDRLLACLHQDRECAGEAYERIRNSSAEEQTAALEE